LIFVYNSQRYQFTKNRSHHVHRVCPPCVRLSILVAFRSLRIRGSIGDGSDVPRASHSRRQSAPLCIFSLLLFHSSRRYVSHPSTRPLTLPLSALAGRDHHTRPLARCGICVRSWSTTLYLGVSCRCDAFDRRVLRVYALIPWSVSTIVAWISSTRAIEIQAQRIQARSATTIAAMITRR
jgi:hypothetical protein